MSKKAVLHIITRLDLGGAQKSCLALIHELQANYPDFQIYLISGTNGELVNQAKQLNNIILLDSLIWEIKPQNIWLELKNFYSVYQIINNLKKQYPNQLIIHTHTIKAGTIGRWAAFLAGVKTRVHTIHGFSFNLYQNKLVWLCFYLVELINSLITSHFICVSSQDLQAGSQIFPFFNHKASIIRAATLNSNRLINPIMPTNIRSHFRHSKSFVQPYGGQNLTIGTIASLKPGKNLFELIKAFKYASNQNPKLSLEIIGNGQLRKALEQYIQENQLETKIKLLGWQKEPIKHAQHWQAFVFTSLWEGLPCAIVEMTDHQIPIISYQVGGISDLISQSSLIYPGNWLNLAQAILKLPTPTPILHKPLHPKTITNDFYIPKMALDHAILYQKLLDLPPF